MKRRGPLTPAREDYALIEFTSSKIAPMRDLIVCCTPGSTVLRGRVLDRFAQWWDRKAIAVDLISLSESAATLEVRAHGVLVASATATPLEVQRRPREACPRCQANHTYELVDVTRRSSNAVTVMTACRDCGWRSSVAEYDLGRTA